MRIAAATALVLAALCAPAAAKPGTAKDGKPAITGTLGASTIRRYVRREIPKLVACYESTRPADGDGPEGNLKVTFTIKGSGQVTDVIAASTGLPTELEACASKVIEAVKFPKSAKRDDVRVVYPFEFAPHR